jgi:hypothetical protein
MLIVLTTTVLITAVASLALQPKAQPVRIKSQKARRGGQEGR